MDTTPNPDSQGISQEDADMLLRTQAEVRGRISRYDALPAGEKIALELQEANISLHQLTDIATQLHGIATQLSGLRLTVEQLLQKEEPGGTR